MKSLNICIAGLGNVGSSVVSSIESNNSIFNSKASLNFNILGVSAKNISKKRDCNIDSLKWFDNPLDLLKINDCQVLIELIGDEKGISFDLVKNALEKKIHVVTANKALLAKNGFELFKIAEKNNVLLLFEAAVAGGIPIIKVLKNDIFLNDIKKISGILNGTTNYILTTMENENLNFDNVISIAQSKGYTSPKEAELDIGGLDSAHKLTLLASLSFGVEINFQNNHITGISKIKIEDIVNAKKLGYKIKLISEATIINNQLYCVTEPKLINSSKPLANVDGVLNAINIQTDHLYSLFLEGEGAGGKATASSVISDLYEISSQSNINSLGYKINNLKKIDKINILNIKSAYYLRIMTKDIAGVLSKITSYFNDSNISIQKMLQLPDNTEQPIPIIISTHQVEKDKLLKAIDNIEKQDFVLEKIVIIPIDES
ncbi:MAG: homoserine dehydrogenase [Alphaproteobacteria bacterium]